jgi:hypothetical protein
VSVDGSVGTPVSGVDVDDAIRGRVGRDGIDEGIDIDRRFDTPLIDPRVKIDQDFTLTDDKINVGIDTSTGFDSPLGGITNKGGIRVEADDDGGSARIGGDIDFGGKLLGGGFGGGAKVGIDAADGAGLLSGEFGNEVRGNLGNLKASAGVGADAEFGQQSDGDLVARGEAGADFGLGFIDARLGAGGGVEVGEDGGSADGDLDLGLVSVGGGVRAGGGGAGVSFSIGGVNDDDQQATVEVTDETVEDAAGDAVGAVFGEDAGDQAEEFVDGVGDFFFGED